MPVFSRLFLAVLAVSVTAFSFPGCEREKKPAVVGDLLIVHPVPLKWTEIENGLQITRLEFTRSTGGQSVMIAALSVDPKFFSFGLLDAPKAKSGMSFGWVSDLAQKAGALAAVNGSFFRENSEPIGLLVVHGRVAHPWRPAAGSGIFCSQKSRASIEWAKDYNPDWEKCDFAIQAGPLVIEPKGQPGIYQDMQKYRARTALGIDKRGRVIVLCTLRRASAEQDLSGLDLFELMRIAQLPAKEGGLELQALLNLDGGVSSSMYLNHPRLKLEISSINPVRNAVAIFKK